MGRRFLQNGEQEKQEKFEKDKRKTKKKGKKKKRDRSKENHADEASAAPFPRKNKDGSTSLAILSPGFGIIPGTERDRPVSLGSLIGRVRVGTSYLHGFREDKRNIVKTMYPINYNFYSSYGPSYDSTFSNLTMEETQLVQAGDKFVTSSSKQYSDLIRNVCLEDYSNTFVDHLIDILEGQEVSSPVDAKLPSDTTAPAAQQQQQPVGVVQQQGAAMPAGDITADNQPVDFDSLKSLTDDGIDMSFLDNLRLEYETCSSREQQQPPENPSVGQRLDFTASLIQNLRHTQNNRLAACPNLQLNQIEPPSHTEVQLASKVLDNLTSLLHTTQPGEVVNVQSIRRAMGIRVVGDEHSSIPVTDDVPIVVAEAAMVGQSSTSKDTEIQAAVVPAAAQPAAVLPVNGHTQP